MRWALALRFSPPLDGRCSLVASATPPTDSGSRSDRRPCLRRGSSVLRGLMGRTRVRPVAARCRRAEWTVSCDAPSVVRNDDRTATLVWPEHQCTGCRPLLRFPLALSRARRRGLWCGFRRFALAKAQRRLSERGIHTKPRRHKGRGDWGVFGRKPLIFLRLARGMRMKAASPQARPLCAFAPLRAPP